MPPEMIATEKYRKVKAGETFKCSHTSAKALSALGMANYKTAVMPELLNKVVVAQSAETPKVDSTPEVTTEVTPEVEQAEAESQIIAEPEQPLLDALTNPESVANVEAEPDAPAVSTQAAAPKPVAEEEKKEEKAFSHKKDLKKSGKNSNKSKSE